MYKDSISKRLIPKPRAEGPLWVGRAQSLSRQKLLSMTETPFLAN